MESPVIKIGVAEINEAYQLASEAYNLWTRIVHTPMTEDNMDQLIRLDEKAWTRFNRRRDQASELRRLAREQG
jgi:hypothetical protein